MSRHRGAGARTIERADRIGRVLRQSESRPASVCLTAARAMQYEAFWGAATGGRKHTLNWPSFRPELQH
jgi:hypothetical protein